MTQLPEKMSAVVLTGHGGPEKLFFVTDYPVPGDDEVLINGQ